MKSSGAVVVLNRAPYHCCGPLSPGIMLLQLIRQIMVDNVALQASCLSQSLAADYTQPLLEQWGLTGDCRLGWPQQPLMDSSSVWHNSTCWVKFQLYLWWVHSVLSVFLCSSLIFRTSSVLISFPDPSECYLLVPLPAGCLIRCRVLLWMCAHS